MNMQCEPDVTCFVEMSTWYGADDTYKHEQIDGLQKRICSYFILVTWQLSPTHWTLKCVYLQTMQIHNEIFRVCMVKQLNTGHISLLLQLEIHLLATLI